MSPGDVVLVQFPFTDLERGKKRPSLILTKPVIAGSLKIITLAMITSQVENLRLPADVLLKKWQEAGLLHPSVVRLDKLVTVEVELVKKKLGVLKSSDQKMIGKNLAAIFSSWL